ncbi:MAG: hypothetical protein IT426_14085 [Pirellulales bacterium]|nr:hypothetical protein [Pirellulales bacterium]
MDTAETGRWQQMLQMHAMIDEFVVQTTASHVPADRLENRQRLARLQSERAGLQRQAAEIAAAAENPAAIPSEAEVRQMIADLATPLKAAVHADDPAETAALRAIIVNLTGGRILLTQQGARKQGEGWLRASFEVELPNALLRKLGYPHDDSGETLKVEIDIQRTTTDEDLMQRAKELYDRGLQYQEIAQHLSCPAKRVRELLKAWGDRHGETLPDGRERRATLDRKSSTVPQYKQLADEARRLWEEDLSVLEIARRLQCSAPTVEKAVRYWHESRKLPVPSESNRRERLFQRAKQLHDAGWELKRIAATVGYSKTGLQRILKKGFQELGQELPDGRSRRGNRQPEIQQSAG